MIYGVVMKEILFKPDEFSWIKEAVLDCIEKNRKRAEEIGDKK